ALLPELPSYPFQHRHYWLTGAARELGGSGLTPVDHPFLTAAVALADGTTVLTGTVSVEALPWLADHRVGGSVLLPGTAFVELASRAADLAGLASIADLTLHAPLVLEPRRPLTVQVTVRDDGDGADLEIHSRPGDDGPWVRHASGRLSAEPVAGAAGPAEWPPAGTTPLDPGALYGELADRGLEYGPLFRGVRRAWRNGSGVYAEVALPEDASAEGFVLHPALLDAALHTIGFSDGARAGLPFSWTSVGVHATGATRLRVGITVDDDGSVAVAATDPAGAPVATIGRLGLRPPGPVSEPLPDGLHTFGWRDLPEPAALPSAPRPLPEPGSAEGDVWVVPEGPEVEEVLAAALAVVRERLRGEDGPLAVVTRGAVSVAEGEGVADLGAAAVRGLVRSAQAEHPGRFVLVDVLDGDAGAVARAVASGEPEVAVRDGRLLGARLLRPDGDGRLTLPPGAWRLVSGGAGTLEEVAAVPTEPEPLGAHEVRVEVRAAGINFRDVLVALGMYPEAAPLGGEAAGVVVETGAEVADLRPGDRVTGLFSGAFGSTAVTDHRMLAPLPAGWSWTDAAGVPAVFATAWYALHDLASLQPGETILIHSAAGGVGMAALQIARHLGARILATAHPTKWHVLRGLGLADEQIASSRDLEFAERFAPVDVVLNSLAGEFTDASLALLKPGGRFIEMGKTDRRDPATLPDGVVYRPFDLAEAGPERNRQILTELMELLTAGSLRPLPTRVWDVRRAPEAFRFISQARHTGKNVLLLPRTLNPDSTVLITGGTGTLGRLIAKHLATTQQARHLILTSRTGPHHPDAHTLRTELEATGAQVTIAACDAADRTALTDLLSRHRLSGVIHAAGILDDATVDNLTPERLHAVLAPKATAAWNLHDLTRDHDLDAFILFSSAAGVMGSPGQANYAAANTYLDALAQHRRAHGLPAVSLAWGLWEQRSGMTGHLDGVEVQRITRGGIRLITAERGLALFDAALRLDLPLQVPAGLDTTEREDVPHLLRALVRTTRRAAAAGEAAPAAVPAADLAALPPALRGRRLVELVRGHTAAVLGHADPAEVAVQTTFKEQGFDSLTAVELRNRLNKATGLRLPATSAFDFPTPALLAEHLLAELAPAEPDAPDVPEVPADPEEAEFRRLLAGIPLRLFREHGLVEAISRLADPGADPAPTDADPIDALDAAALVRRALGSADLEELPQ
ncbi:SDR family NAD(P)-dependent oxidoreductase, partial [Actinocorallia aurantiaca]